MTKNKLPEYWVVQNDGSQLFKDSVIKYMNEIRGKRIVDYNIDFYYGVGKGCIACASQLKYFGECELLSIWDFISLTEEKEEWPKPGERIFVRDCAAEIWKERIFIKINAGSDFRYSCQGGNDSTITINWKRAKPIEQPKEVPFTPTVGKVCWLYDENENYGANLVFVSKSGDQFIGAEINEYDDLIKGHRGQVELYKHAAPARKETKEVTFSEVAQKFDTTVDKLKIKGYVNEQDAVADAKKMLKESLKDKLKDAANGKVLISIYEIIST
jgi:hypothetical protein